MKKTIFLLLILAIGAIGCSSVANKITEKLNDTQSFNGNDKASSRIVTKEVKLNGQIEKISNYTSVDVEYKEGEAGVTVTGPDNMAERLEVMEQGVTINLRLKKGVSHADFSKVKVTVTLPTLNEITLHGSGDFTAENIDAIDFTATLLGSGDLQISNLSTSPAKFLIRGSGDVKLGKVECTVMQCLTQGSGDLSVNSLTCTSAQTIIQGSGDAGLHQVEATQLDLQVQGSGDIAAANMDVNILKASIQGSGDISLDGKAGNVSLNVQGTGDISARRLKYSRVSKSSQGTGEIHL